MRRENLKARLLRALSGKTQDQFAREIGVHPSMVAQIELGLSTAPRPELLARMAESAALGPGDAEEILRLAETLGRERQRRGREESLDLLGESLRDLLSRTLRRLLTLPAPERLPVPEDRLHAGERFERLLELDHETALAVLRVDRDFQGWALCERLCEESVEALASDLGRASALAQLAWEIAMRVCWPEGFGESLKGYAAGHQANVLRVAGELKAAGKRLGEATRLWEAGRDSSGVLDPGRLLHFEAALCRDQRLFAKALALLDEAAAVSYPERALLNKGFTLEVMGEYEEAIEVLFKAAPLVERQGRPRDRLALFFNLAVNFTLVGRHGEAEELVPQARDLAVELGDAINLIRILWLEGRVSAGKGRAEEALRLLEQARQQFEERGMWYDVALALLEEAVLLLEVGRAAEVKELAKGLIKVFESKGVHREALAALRLFQEAAEHEAATAEMAEQVLRFLFRARWDEGLRFEG
jgi:transcriptional regulator with XRE-family HTH domain